MTDLATQKALSGYSIMWLFVMFDLPTDTKKQRKAAGQFRKALIKDGFVMHQFSVYIRHCASNEATVVHINRVKNLVPEEGLISIVKITDAQYGQTINLVGRKSTAPKAQYVQMEFF